MTATTDVGSTMSVGLSSAEAQARLLRNGPNELPATPKEGWPARVYRQAREPMALLLIVAATVSVLALDELVDGMAILGIVVANAAIGLFQETKAEHALEALRDLQAPTARVMRDGAPVLAPAAEVVVGDALLLGGGDRISADGALAESVALEVDESLLTGESLPIPKTTDADAAVFAGTFVTKGTGTLMVTSTGSDTRLASIASGLQEEKPPTPLQTELRSASLWLGAIALAAAAIVFVLVIAGRGDTTMEIAFLTAISVAVAAVPEGLATVVAVALALGVRRMASRGAIVRNLPAVETLGATTVIATDKTGTLTENRMRVGLVCDAQGVEPSEVVRTELARAVASCNDASLDPPSGDPLEVALLEWAGPENHLLRVAAAPFDSDRKLMSTVHRASDGYVVYTKGAPEQVLARCESYLDASGVPIVLAPPDRRLALSVAESAASTGVRMLAVARRTVFDVTTSACELELDLTLIGFVGMRDPVRPEAADAVGTARRAGVDVVMVTGDHRGTAEWVASQVGLEALSVGSTDSSAGVDLRARRSVYARVSPGDKIRLVRDLQEQGEVVAVTGDGVNDGPALRGANIGIAMGGRGTDVARAASDMVITDDNLGTIVHAIREGRSIYDNIRHVVQYLVAANLAEILVVVAGLILFPSLAPPLLPLQILWINLVTDGFPALGLGVGPTEKGVMERGPRRLGSRLLERRSITTLAVRATLFASACLVAVGLARSSWSAGVSSSRTILFVSLALAQLIYAFVVRRPPISLLHSAGSRNRLLANPWLLAGVGLGGILLVGPVLLPVAHDLFGLAVLSGREWALAIAAATLPNAVIVALEPPSRRA